MAKKDDEQKPVVIKKKKKRGGGGHHGGAWKVAYADFTTAMMAFFMMLWMLNVTDKETLEGLADYFTPSSASTSGESGAGEPLAGTVAADSGSKGGSNSVMEVQGPPTQSRTSQQSRDDDNASDAEERQADFEQRREKVTTQGLAALQDELRQAVQDSPELARHRDQILIEQTPEGVRIQLTDKDDRSMFQQGTAEFYDYAEDLVRDLGSIVAGLPNRVALIGHTDASAASHQVETGNWELSAERANAARRVLADTGVSADRFAEVTGKAATDPLYPTAPSRAENRRIAILVMREAPVVAPGASGGAS